MSPLVLNGSNNTRAPVPNNNTNRAGRAMCSRWLLIFSTIQVAQEILSQIVFSLNTLAIYIAVIHLFSSDKNNIKARSKYQVNQKSILSLLKKAGHRYIK